MSVSVQFSWSCYKFHIEMGQTYSTYILKISRATGVILRLRHIYPREILLTLYNTLILPHLNYCILVWGSKN